MLPVLAESLPEGMERNAYLIRIRRGYNDEECRKSIGQN